jgi:hypothetical protein
MDQLPRYQIDDSLRSNPEKYYDRREAPFHVTNSPEAFQGHLEFQDPTSLGAYNYNAPHTNQNYIDNLMNGPYLGYRQPEARHQWLPPFSNSVNPVMQPFHYQGPNPPPANSAHGPRVDLNLEGSNVPWTSDSLDLVPNSHKLGNRGNLALQDSDALGQESASPEFAQAWSPADAIMGLEPERVLKRRRFMYDQRLPDGFDYTTPWQGIGNETEAVGSRSAAPMSQETSSALEVPETFKNPYQTNAMAPEAPQASSCFPSALTAAGHTRIPSYPSASRVSAQVEDPDLNAYRQTIGHMYLTLGKTLDEVKKFMAEAHNVVARYVLNHIW